MNLLPNMLRIFYIQVFWTCIIMQGYDFNNRRVAVSAVLYYDILLIRKKWWHSEKSWHDVGIQVNVMNITWFPLTFKYTSFDLCNMQISVGSYMDRLFALNCSNTAKRISLLLKIKKHSSWHLTVIPNSILLSMSSPFSNILEMLIQ